MTPLLATFGCLALITGAGAALGAWLGRGRDDDAPLRIGWSYLLGCAALGIALHVPLAIDGRISHFNFAAALLGAAALTVWFLARRWKQIPWKPTQWSWHGDSHVVLRLAVGATLLVAFASAVSMRPNSYDGRAAFGLKARVLYDAGTIRNEDFEDVNRLHFNAHYPLLLPLLQAEIYWAQGSTDDSCMRAIFAMFVLALLSVVSGELRRQVGPKGAAGWTFLPLLTPMVITTFEGGGLSASADIPFACFVTAAVIEVAAWLRRRDPRRAATAGLMLGAACLAKAEGTIWVVALAAALAWLAMRRAWRIDFGRLRSAASGVALLAGMIAISALARRHVPASPYLRDYVQALRWDWLVQVAHRPWEIVQYAVEEFSNFDRWNLFWLCAVVGYVGLRRKYPASLELRFAQAATVCIILAYFAIFVITPYHLHFHLRTALCRLVLHFLPLLVLLLAERVQASGVLEIIVENWRPLAAEERTIILSGRFSQAEEDEVPDLPVFPEADPNRLARLVNKTVS